MRTSALLVAVSALASAASAAVLQARQYPACVGTCIQSAAASIDCSPSDAMCLCNSNVFINNVAGCFGTSCSAADADTGVKLGQQLCSAIGVTVTIPREASAALAGASGASGASAASGAATTPASGASSVVSGATSAVQSAQSAITSAAAGASSSAPAGAPNAAVAASNSNSALAGLVVLGALMTIAL